MHFLGQPALTMFFCHYSFVNLEPLVGELLRFCVYVCLFSRTSFTRSCC